MLQLPKNNLFMSLQQTFQGTFTREVINFRSLFKQTPNNECLLNELLHTGLNCWLSISFCWFLLDCAHNFLLKERIKGKRVFVVYRKCQICTYYYQERNMMFLFVNRIGK